MRTFLDSLDNCSDEDKEKDWFRLTTKDFKIPRFSYCRFSWRFINCRFTQDFVQVLLLEDLPNILFRFTIEDWYDSKIFPAEDSPQDFQDFAQDSQDFKIFSRFFCWRFSSNISRFHQDFQDSRLILKTWLLKRWSWKDSRFLDFTIHCHYS